ncbi:MAG: hypothetical protein RMA76_27020 [Deltaproteobacteria bacterium]
MSTVIPVETFPRVVRSEVMDLDAEAGTPPPDGVLTRAELQRHVERLHDKYDRGGDRNTSPQMLELNIRTAERILEDMVAVGADGLDYLPPQVRDANLPDNLKYRAIEILVHDDKRRTGQITRSLISKAKRRYTGSGRTVGTSNNEAEAIREITQLAKALHLN